MDFVDLRGDELEVLVDRTVGDVGRVRVPAHVDVRVVGGGDDLCKVGQLLRDASVDFEADLDAEAGRVFSHFVQSAADLLEGRIQVRAFGDAIGPHLNAGRSDVMGQADVLLRPLDVLAHLRWVGRLVFEGASEPR